MKKLKVLVADDEEMIRKLSDFALRKAGYEVILAKNGKEAISLVSDDICCALIDLKMPEIDGMGVLKHINQEYPQIPVVVMSAVGKIRDAITAIRQGAFEYLTKPHEIPELLVIIESACRYGEAIRERQQLRDILFNPPHSSDFFVGSSPATSKFQAEIETIAALNSSVLITGESGTGKSFIARMIHRLSSRNNNAFIVASCPTLPRELVESEMFGHEKGAFTGAHQRRIGKIELAENGTLFLDEIGDLPLMLQPKLLNVLQDKQFQRVGGTTTITANVRIITATNSDLKTKVATREFREDLYYRLNVFEIHVPTLRDRKEDIPKLAVHILNKITKSRNCKTQMFSEEAIAALENFHWPGNIRQLENVIERSSAYCKNDIIDVCDLPPEFGDANLIKIPKQSEPMNLEPDVAGVPLVKLEQIALKQTLEKHKGNKAAAARSLGITEKSIYNKLDRFGMR